MRETEKRERWEDETGKESKPSKGREGPIMGNEASLEGGEGPPSGLPEGLAPDGKGGFVRVADGTPVNLSELSVEERNQLAAAMSRAQSRQPGGAAAARRQGFLPEYFIFKIHFRRPHRAGDEKCGRNEWRCCVCVQHHLESV
ncbi:hypothetical protein Q8A73_021969 [Channa argus]|nr:hypothetical protein Q8A73_021969 [Channa argus]